MLTELQRGKINRSKFWTNFPLQDFPVFRRWGIQLLNISAKRKLSEHRSPVKDLAGILPLILQGFFSEFILVIFCPFVICRILLNGQIDCGRSLKAIKHFGAVRSNSDIY